MYKIKLETQSDNYFLARDSKFYRGVGFGRAMQFDSLLKAKNCAQNFPLNRLPKRSRLWAFKTGASNFGILILEVR